MANEHNLIPFNRRSEREAREMGAKGGKASGEVRRRKADFRKTLNALLTTEIDNPEITPLLKALGLNSTLESAVNMVMIKEAMAGNVKAYIAIRDTIGQTTKSEEDLEEQKVKVDSLKAKTQDTEESVDARNVYDRMTEEELIELVKKYEKINSP